MRYALLSAVTLEFLAVLNEVSDEDVFVPVIVDIEKNRRGPQALRVETGLFGGIRERAIAIVAVENISPVVRYEEIGLTILVEITSGRSDAKVATRNSRFEGDIREGTVAVVAVQRV